MDVWPMPRPEYKDPSKKTIYAEVAPEIKGMLGDIVYALDSTEKDALASIIADYHQRHGIKPRPSRKAKKSG